MTRPLKSLSRIRHVALDMDGTIYKGSTLFDCTLPFLALMKQLGIGYTFLTNNSSKSVRDYLAHLERMGISAAEEEMYTSTWSAVDYLREEHPGVERLFVLGTESLREEIRRAGFTVLPDDEKPDLVLVGFDPALPIQRAGKAAWWISKGIPYVATHPDRVCPTDQPTIIIDCGAICACLQSATGRAPLAVLGKPDRRMLSGLMARHGLEPGELAMVGDRIYTDIAMAWRSGAFGVLVLTGESTAEDARATPEPPDLVLPSLKELGELIRESRPAVAPLNP